VQSTESNKLLVYECLTEITDLFGISKKELQDYSEVKKTMILGYELLNFMPKQYLSNAPTFREYTTWVMHKKRNGKAKIKKQKRRKRK
jgi:hypothetical protein